MFMSGKVRQLSGQVQTVLATVAIGVFGTTLPAVAGTFNVSPTEAFDNWTREASPWRDSVNEDAWTVSGSQLQYTHNVGQSLISDFSLSGDFNFTSRIQSLDGDDDRFGLLFGYQDSQNNYRFSWEGDFTNGGVSEADGSRGLSLIREVNGTSASLFNLSSNWLRNTPYDITVSRVDDAIGFEVKDLSGSIVASTSVVDTTFTEGKLGLWNTSQRTGYSNIEVDVGSVPEPTGLLAIAIVGVGLCLRRRAT